MCMFKEKKKTAILVGVIIAILIGGGIGFGIYKLVSKDTEKETTTGVKPVTSKYRMSGNSLDAFDLYFLQLENNNKNLIYSPLSIKYALEMLGEGADGDSKEQINAIIGDYKYKKYNNSANMSFANAFFIKDSYKNSIKQDYITNLNSKYNAEIIYDSFVNPNNLNNWTSNKTFGLINNLFDDVSANNFILINALAIDMEWKNLIQPAFGYEPYDKDHSLYGSTFSVSYPHEDYGVNVDEIMDDVYKTLQFNNSINAKAVTIGASINKYDIVKTIGEENIRKTVGDAYNEWVKKDECGSGSYESTNEFLNRYINELDSSYKDVASSTDFKFYVDDDTKVFAKELKKYNDTTLEYIGIMPKKQNLNEYIKDINAEKINNLINNLKSIELNNFDEGKVTKIVGDIPLFKFNYELNLMNDLQKLGITNVFDSSKANLSNMTTDKGVFINQVSHKANIEFSNVGIKAAAVTEGGGYGDMSCEFEYLYDVPVETIDITFDKPYLFLIRDKDTGEVWFAGSVYEPIINNSNNY